MISQNGTLVILPNKLNIGKRLQAGSYFMLKFGNSCVRFDSVKGPLEMKVSSEHWNQQMGFVLFRRRPRLNGDPVGFRRRDIIEQTSLSIKVRKPERIAEYCVTWKNIELDLPVQDIQLIFDLEFYPSDGPIKPLKKNQPYQLQANELKERRPNIRQKSPEPVKHQTEPMNKVKPSHTILNRFKKGIKNLRHIHSTDRTDYPADESEVVYDNVIEYNKEEPQQVVMGNYVHGMNMPEIVDDSATNVDTMDVYSFIRRNKEISANRLSDDDTLVIGDTPRDLMKNKHARLSLGERVQFAQIFPSRNTRLTGYVGNGKWVIPEGNEFRRQYYMLHGKALPAPQVPPKCPKGMLWEEYYLLDKDKYTNEVIRN